MFRSNFDEFSGPRHDRSKPRVGKVENRARMTWFCTRNKPTLVWEQILPFSFIMTEKCFDQILMTFPGSKINGAGSKQYDWKLFRSNFDNFSSPGHH